MSYKPPEISWEQQIEKAIFELIEQEDPEEPMNDSELTQALFDNYGIRIARRTLTDYRVKLKIPPIKGRRKPISK